MNGGNAVPRYAFDDYQFDARTLELFRNGQIVRLQRQPATLLLLLLERAGSLVSKDEVRSRIWGSDRFVDLDRSMAFCLRQVRAALDDDPRAPRYVETLRGLGYRFVGDVRVAPDPIRDPASVADASGPSAGCIGPPPSQVSWWRRQISLRTAAVSMLLAVTAGALWSARGLAPADPGSSELPLSGTAVLLRRAGEYLDRGRPDDVARALSMYRDALARTPDSARARAGVAAAEAWLAHHHRDWSGAQRAVRTAFDASRLAPSDPDVVVSRGLSLQSAGRYDEAADAFRTALRLAPDRLDLLHRLALLAHERGRLDEAVQLLVRRVSMAGPDPASAGLLGVILTELGFDAEAHEWTRLAATLAPDNLQSRYSGGLRAVRAGRLEEAEEILTEAVQTPDPGALLIGLWAAVVVHRHGPGAALPRLEDAARAMPNSHQVRGMLSAVYSATGRTEDARRERAQVEAICRAGLEAAPEAPAWPRCLASYTAAVGDREAAVEWYDRAVTLGWRKLKGDREDGGLVRLAGDPRFQAIQSRMAADIDRMRQTVARAGIPRAALDAGR